MLGTLLICMDVLRTYVHRYAQNICTYVRSYYMYIPITYVSFNFVTLFDDMTGYKGRIDEFKKESQRLLSKQHFDSLVISEKMSSVEQHYSELTKLTLLRKHHLTESKQLHEFKR